MVGGGVGGSRRFRLGKEKEEREEKARLGKDRNRLAIHGSLRCGRHKTRRLGLHLKT